MLASEPQIVPIRLPVILWARTVAQLRRRSAGRRESGAFLLGRTHHSSSQVTSFICYDDLDPNAYHNGAIAFHAAGHAALWKICRQEQLQVLADVHTHPGSSIHQSTVDRRNPMIPVSGHIALIVPNFGLTPWWSLRGVGVYEYLGDFQWRVHDAGVNPRSIKLTLW